LLKLLQKSELSCRRFWRWALFFRFILTADTNGRE
jgi:hypothetical protein